jgi:phage terminase large subunit-like protein
MSILIQNKTIWTPDNSYLLEYRGRAETGEIVIGQELWTELDNLAEDMTSDRYIYDREDALLRMDFMENCVRLTKSPYYNKPMVLMLWQKALIEAFYSFKMADTELDRFKKLLLLIARKNTKSETSSALAESELIVGEPGADIVASSNDDAQASIVYDAIDTMRQLIDPKDQDTKRNQRYIINKVNNTKIFKLSDRTRNKEGRNIDFAIVDETHEMKDNVIGKSIEQSQSLKENPKFINITTEGFVIDGYLDDELKKARAVISREADDPASERFLPWLYTQDSESEVWNGNRSNRLWMKSNPTLGIVKKWDYLEEQVALARSSKADRIFVLSKDFNIKQNAAESWLNLEDYEYECRYDLEDFRGSFALGAVDLAETTDLVSAKALIMKPDDPKKYIVSHYFIPENKLVESDDKEAGAHYKEWAEAGLMTITEGADVDLAIVADWFYSLYEQYNIKLWKCGYDQRFSKDWLKRMEYYGWFKTGNDDSSDVIMINQNAQTLSNAIKLTESDFKHKLIYYDNHAVDKWCFGNAGLKVDNNGCLIVKMETKKRIDGAVSLAILYEMYRRYRTDFKTIVEK